MCWLGRPECTTLSQMNHKHKILYDLVYLGMNVYSLTVPKDFGVLSITSIMAMEMGTTEMETIVEMVAAAVDENGDCVREGLN